MNELEMEVDRCNRIALSKNAILLGMPTKKDENVKQIVENVSTTIGYELPVGAIVEVKRLSASDPKQRNKDAMPIKIVFSNEQYKEDLPKTESWSTNVFVNRSDVVCPRKETHAQR